MAKGIARDELPFAMTTYNTLVRQMLETMLDWYIGIHTDFSVSAGKMNKYLKKYLPEQMYQEYTATYTDGEYANFCRAVDRSYDLFRKTALQVADCLGYAYAEEEENASRMIFSMLVR